MEGSVQSSCPQCGSSITLPEKWTSGGERAKPHRNCTCSIPSAFVSESSPEDLKGLARLVESLRKHIEILMHLIPSGYINSCPPMGIDIHSDQKFSLHEMIALNRKAIGELGFKETFGSCLNYSACRYCGTIINPYRTDNGIGEAKLVNLFICPECSEVARSNNLVFSWVTKVLRWHLKVHAASSAEFSLNESVSPPPPKLEPRRPLLIEEFTFEGEGI